MFNYFITSLFLDFLYNLKFFIYIIIRFIFFKKKLAININFT